MSSEVVGDQQHKRDDSALTQLDGAQERPAAGAAAPAGLMPPPPTEVVAGVGAPPSPLAAGTGVASSPPASGTSALAGGARSATGSAVNTPARPAPKPGLLAQALAGHKAEPVGSQSPPASDFGLAEGESRDALLHPQRGQHAVSGIAQALSSQSLSDTLSGSVKTDVVRTGMRLVQAFLLEKTAYELLPESGKVVVLDIDLHVRSAFEAVAEHSITSALLWDSELGRYVGILSVSDFIFLLLRLRDTRDTRSIEDFTVREWRGACAVRVRVRVRV